MSICKGTFFKSSHVALSITVALLHMFCEDTPCIYSSQVKKHLSYEKTVSWYEEFRRVCSEQLLKEPIWFERDGVSISTKDLEVEVEESWFGKKRKYNRGTSRQTSLLFGIVENKRKKCTFYLVHSNNRETLLLLIKKHISASVHIYHDGLATYSSLHQKDMNISR